MRMIKVRIVDTDQYTHYTYGHGDGDNYADEGDGVGSGDWYDMNGEGYGGGGNGLNGGPPDGKLVVIE